MMLSWKQLASIEIGGAISLPVILVGHTLCMKFGFQSALLAIGIGNLFLLSVALFSAKLSVLNRCSTPELAKGCFGSRGIRLFAIILMMTKLGWFAVQLTMMSESVQSTVLLASGCSIPLALLNISFGLLIVAVALFGLKSISFLSTISLPFMVITLSLALFFAVRANSFTFIPSRTIGFSAISVAIAAAITAVLDMPTYFQFARRPKDATIAVLLLFLVCLPVIEIVGVLLASFHPEKSLVSSLLGTSLIWNGWVTLFLIIAAWTTNNTNLYSANVCFGVLFKRFKEPLRMALLGCMGILLSLLPLLQSFTIGLQVMGISIGCFGGVIYSSYFFNGSRYPVVAWSIAVVIGWMSLAGIIRLTSIPLCDSFFVSILLTSLMTKTKVPA